MTREEFIKGYAERSNLKPSQNGVYVGNRRLYALPCVCEDESCSGWAMISDEALHDHLCRRAPEPLRQAYLDAVGCWF